MLIRKSTVRPRKLRLRGEKAHGRAFVISFVVVFVTLTAAYVGVLYLSGQVKVHHIPSDVSQYSPAWGKYVPAGYFQAAFQNYSLAREVNPSAPPENTILQLVTPVVNLTTDQIGAIVSVTLSKPNQTIDVAFLSTPAYGHISSVLLNSQTYNSSVGPCPTFLVGDNVNNTLEVGWLGLVAQDHAIAFALGSGQAQDGLKAVLNAALGNSPSFLSEAKVSQIAYIANGTSSLAVGFENFPGVVRSGNLTATFVRLDGGTIVVSNVVGFNSSVTPSSQYKYTKQTYNTFTAFKVYDRYILAQANWSVSRLEESLRLVGGG